MSGISAEYGRFGGGVVNVITRSGSNDFHGSFRANLARPSWTEETPFERERNQTRSDVLSKTYEGTIGGPIVRDRLWFFNADRYENSTTAGVFAEIGGAFTTDDEQQALRAEAHRHADRESHGQRQLPEQPADAQQSAARSTTTMTMTAATLVNRHDVNRLWVVNWNGALTSKLFGTFQWSRKDQGIRDAGGTSTVITDSPFLTRGVVAGSVNNRHYNAPFFSANDPEDRNNRQFTGSLSYFFTTPTIGRHDLKVGFEHFTSFRNGGNSQSATGYVIPDRLPVVGRPAGRRTGR